MNQYRDIRYDTIYRAIAICNTDAEEKLNGYATYWQHKFKIESCIAYLR